MPKHTISQINLRENLKNEINIHKKLRHPHIIRLYYFFEDIENVYMVLEYAENANLSTLLKKRKRLSEKETFIYFMQTCLAVDYLHKKKIIHRDLKVNDFFYFISEN